MDPANPPLHMVILGSAIMFILITSLLMVYILGKKEPGYSLLGFKRMENHFMLVPLWFRLFMALTISSVGIMGLIEEGKRIGIVPVVIALVLIYIGVRIILPKK